VYKSHDPSRKSLEAYKVEKNKQIRAWEVQTSETFPEDKYQILMFKAETEQELEDQGNRESDEQLATIQHLYLMEALEIDETAEQQCRIAGLEEMYEEHGGELLYLRSSAIGAHDGVTPSFQGLVSERGRQAHIRDVGAKLSERGQASSAAPVLPAGVQSAAAAGSSSQEPGLQGLIFRDELDRLAERLRETEAQLTAEKMSRQGSPMLAQVMEKHLDAQNELMQAIVDNTNRPQKAPGSTIRVEPKIVWPKFGDQDHGGQYVEEFYEKFEEVCGLANEGQRNGR